MENLKQNERITELRNRLGLTMEAFGEKIGLSRQSISNIESGRRSVTNRMIMAIASKYGVSEKWLETGEGEMFVADTQAYHRLREKVDRVLSDESEAFRAALVDVVLRLNSEQIEVLKEYAARYYGVTVGGEEGQAGEETEDAAATFADPAAASPDPEDQTAAATFASAAAASPDPEDQGTAATFAETAEASPDPAVDSAAASPEPLPIGSFPRAETGQMAAADEPVGLSGKDVVEIERMVMDYRAQLIAEKKAAAASAASRGPYSKKEA